MDTVKYLLTRRVEKIYPSKEALAEVLRSGKRLMMKKRIKQFDWKRLKRILVCIDAANLENSVKDLGWWIDYKKLFNFFEKQAKLVAIRHYCVRFKTERHEKFLTVLKRHGFKLVTKPLKIIKKQDLEKGDHRKANFDVEITVDVLELMNKFQTLVLFSGDSDFDYLIKYLKVKGDKKVIVISTKHHVSRELIESSNFYFDLRKLKRFFERKRT